jgi:protein-S-isoprenylcysteine O-methyltransferase Ste14
VGPVEPGVEQIGRQGPSVLRALIAFLACPSVVGMLVPIWISSGDRFRTGSHPLGLLCVALGLGGLLWCVRDFYVVGKGTLAPWAPPRRLVVVGLYRYVRNPMYLAVLILVAGIGIWRGSPMTLAYAALLFIVFDLRVRLFEERWLERTFGDAWGHYRAGVGRWVPHLRPRRSASTP